MKQFLLIVDCPNTLDIFQKIILLVRYLSKNDKALSLKTNDGVQNSQFLQIIVLQFKISYMKSDSKSITQLLFERKFAILILLFQIGVIFAHAFGANYPIYSATVPQTDFSNQMILYTLTSFLALLGYGLVIAYSDSSAITGLVTTLFVAAISVQLTPLLLQFWYNAFNGFKHNADISLTTERITMALCTSLLVCLTSLVGRLGKIQTFIIIILYNIGWTLNFQATQYIQANKSPSTPQLYDDYGTNYIYVFAGLFTFFTSIVINFKPGKRCPPGSRHSVFISLIGTGFIFACFPFTGILYPTTTNIYRNFEGPLNIYFALTASVICTYISSAIFGKLKIGIRQSLIGVLSGGVTIGAVASTINNIGACIAIGAFSGFISGFYLQILHPRLNQNRAIDHLGIFGPILICSIFGGILVSPAMYKAYMSLGIDNNNLGTIISSQSILYQLVYIGVSAIIASGSGILAGLAVFNFRDSDTDFAMDKLVSTDYGIFRADESDPEKDKTSNRQVHQIGQQPQQASLEPEQPQNPRPAGPQDIQTNAALINDAEI